MTIYEKAKDLVTAREAAENYGLTVNRNGMACCPFHDDHHPSMKLDERFHCFACGADGDVIDLVAGLFDLSPYEAAEMLIKEYGTGQEEDHPTAWIPRQKSPERRCHDVLLELETRLHRQKRETMPTDPDKPIPIEYAQNCQMYDFIVCLADLLSSGPEFMRRDAMDRLMDGVLGLYEEALQKEVITYADIFGESPDLA